MIAAGIKKLLPESFRKHDMFDKIHTLVGVPVATVQLRFDGWVTELEDMRMMKNLNGEFSDGKAPGLDNLLYSADAEFSCFAGDCPRALTHPVVASFRWSCAPTAAVRCRCGTRETSLPVAPGTRCNDRASPRASDDSFPLADLALTSPADYYKPGEGSLLECVLTPADRFMNMDPEEVARITLDQVFDLFPSAKAQGLKCTWSNVVKLQRELLRLRSPRSMSRSSTRLPASQTLKHPTRNAESLQRGPSSAPADSEPQPPKRRVALPRGPWHG